MISTEPPPAYEAPSEQPAAEPMETITIEFSNRYQFTPAGPVIQLYSRSWITHVDLVLDNGHLLGAVPPVVMERSYTPAIHRRFTVPVTHEQKAAILDWAKSQKGKPYDFVTLALFAFKTGIGSGDAAFDCSEYVVKALRVGGIDLAPGVDAEKVTPAALAKSNLLTELASEKVLDHATTPSE